MRLQRPFSQFVIDNISSPVVVTLHGLRKQFTQSYDIVDVLQDELNISAVDAQKRILRKIISNMNVDINHNFSLGEAAIEIMGCLRLIENLSIFEQHNEHTSEPLIEVDDHNHNFSILSEIINDLNNVKKDIEKLSKIEPKQHGSYITSSNPDISYICKKVDENYSSLSKIKENLENEVKAANTMLENVKLKRRIIPFPDDPNIGVVIKIIKDNPRSPFYTTPKADEGWQMIFDYIDGLTKVAKDIKEFF